MPLEKSHRGKRWERGGQAILVRGVLCGDEGSLCAGVYLPFFVRTPPRVYISYAASGTDFRRQHQPVASCCVSNFAVTRCIHDEDQQNSLSSRLPRFRTALLFKPPHDPFV